MALLSWRIRSSGSVRNRLEACRGQQRGGDDDFKTRFREAIHIFLFRNFETEEKRRVRKDRLAV